MADGKVLLEVIVEGKNVKVVQRDVERVTDAVNENTNAQGRNTRASRQNADAARAAGDAHNHFDRGLKGSAGASSNGTKNFSKMRDSMAGSSGLVGAYATLAANLFAATAAFGALQRAAGVEQLTQGLSALGAASGVAMSSLSRGLQESTGYAISLQDSMRSVAMVTSAGFDPSVIERLGAVAKNTSIALGRDLQDSLNRVVKGATKLEPELLDELGIMVRIDEASQKYALALGKNASQLTNFEKRQGFMNAVLEEGEKKFGAIGESVGVNPYDKLSASLQELGTTVLNAFNVILNPIVGFLTDSKLALAGLIAILSKGIISQALPILSEMAAATASLALKTSQAAEIANESAKAEIDSRKSNMASLDAVLGKRGKVIDTALEEAKSLQELSKVQTTVNKSLKAREAIERRDPGTQKNQIEALEEYKKKLQEIIDLEAKRLEKQKAGGDTAGAAKATLLVSGAERLDSLDKNSNLANYKEQFTGALDDAKKFREEMATTINSNITLSSVLTKIGLGFQRVGLSIKRFAIDAKGAIMGFVTNMTLGGVKAQLTFAGIAAAAQRASVAITSFGVAAKIAIKGIFTAIPVIGQVLFFLDLLIQAVTWLFNLFRSNEGKAYATALDEASKTTEELTKNSKEVNSALLGTSKTITTQAQLIDAQSNIVSTASSEFDKLKKAQEEAAAGGAWWGTSVSKITDNLDTQIDSNKLLQKEFQNYTGQTGKSFSDLNTYIKENNLTEKEALDIGEKFLEFANKKIKAQQNLAKSVADTNDALSQYINKLKLSTEYTVLREKLNDSIKALESSTNAAEGYANTLTLVQGLSDQQIKFYGLKEAAGQFENLNKSATAIRNLDSIKVKAMKQEDGVTAVNANLKALGLQEIAIGSSQKQIEAARVEALEKMKASRQGIFELEKQTSNLITETAKKELVIIQNLERQGLIVEAKENSLKNINELIKEEGFITSKNAALRDNSQKESYTAQLGLLALQEVEQVRQLNLQTETNDILASKAKIEETQGKRAIVLAKQLNFARSFELRAAEDNYANLQLQMKGEQEIISILQKQLELSGSILAARQNLQEISMEVQNLQAGGDAALSARQQLKVFQDFEQDKKDNIEREYALKVRFIQMEEKLNNAKLAIARADLQLLIMKTEDQKVALAGRGGAEYTKTVELIESLTSAYNELTGLNYSQIAAAQQTQASLGRAVDLKTLERDNLQKQKDVNLEIVNVVEKQIELANVTGNIQEKMNSSRSSILDNERTIRENELKAINLRNKGIGQYELTAQQTLQLEMEFGEKKKALLRQEEEMKLKIIDLEYKLMGAQLKIQEATLTTSLQNLRNQTTDPIEIGNIDSLINTVPGIFKEAAAYLPEAARLATAATRSETQAAVSEITAAQIQAQQTVFGWTQKMTTSWQDVATAIGQNFIKTLQDAKSITQELADAFSNSVNAAVDAFVDAIVEGKNAFKAIGDALRDSLRDSFAEAAKNKLKEGIAGIGSGLIAKIAPGKGAAEDFTKLLQGPQERLAIASESTATSADATTKAVVSHTELLQQIANNTANCCTGSMASLTPSAIGTKPGNMSPWDNPNKPPPVDLAKRVGIPIQETAKTSQETAVASREGNWLTDSWGKLQESATNNVGTIAATGFASMAAALAAGASPKKALLGGVLGSIGAIVGGAFGGPAGAGGGQAMGQMLGDAASTRMAKGGVMSSAGSMPLHKYGRGGIARTPQLAMFGEGSRPEAYVPLQDGRSIPVTMANGGGNINNISVNVAVDNKGGAQTQTQSGDNTEEYSRRLGTAVSNAVKQEMINQQRPGGLLYKGRR